MIAPSRSLRAGSARDLAGGLAITAGGLCITLVIFVLGTQSARQAVESWLVAAGVGGGAVLVATGLAFRAWPVLGRVGRTLAITTILCAVAVVGPWPIALVGELGYVVAMATLSLVAARDGVRPAWALVVEAIGALLIVVSALGQPWLVLAFGLSSIVLGVLSVDGTNAPSASAPRFRVGRSAVVALVAVVCLVAEAVLVGLPARIVNGAPTVPVRTASLPRMDVVIDTDMLGDDWMAILYLLSEPSVDVAAITVAGTSAIGCDAGVEMAHKLVAAAGRAAIPVACGQETPLRGAHFFPTEWGRDALALAGTIGLSPAGGSTTSHDAAGLLTTTSGAASEPIVIVALGPLTNVALALGVPSVVDHVSRVVIMGGALDAPGNVGSDSPAEWNIFIDPAAANAVLRSGVAITLVPLDATDHVPVTADIAARLSGQQSSPAATMVGHILGGQPDFIASGTYYFWDPLAAAIARDERLARLTTEHVGVIEDGPEVGRTVRDPSAPAIQVAVNADAAGFERTLVEALTGRAR